MLSVSAPVFTDQSLVIANLAGTIYERRTDRSLSSVGRTQMHYERRS